MRVRESQSSFVHGALLPKVVSPDAPRVLNILDEYRDYIKEKGLDEIEASEQATQQIGGVRRVLSNYLQDWDAQGLPIPMVEDIEQEHVFVAWPHIDFLRLSGLDATIDRNFCATYRYLRTIDGRQFLVVCAIFLKCLGFDTAFICDGPGDEGVDLLGRVENGGLRSLCVVVQAKTSQGRLGRGTVVSEYSKYLALPHAAKNRIYRDLLKIGASREGVALVYMLVSNSEFDYAAQDAARKLGFLVRSNAQVAFAIAQRYSKEDVETEVKRLQREIGIDLGTNFVRLIGG